MLKQIILIRCLQFCRILQDLGWVRATLAIVLLVLFFNYIFNSLSILPHIGLIVLATSIAAITIHTQRRDRAFLAMIARQTWLIYWVEYVLLTTPIFIALIINQYFVWAIIQIIALAAISVIPNRTGTPVNRIHNRFINLIPPFCFEIKSGIRRYFGPFVAIYVSGVCSIFWVGGIPVAIIALLFIFLNFYQQCESRQIIDRQPLTPHRFLVDKLTRNLQIFAVICLPLLGLFVWFHPNLALLIALEMLLALLILAFAIVLKYALYAPNTDLTANSLIIAIALFFPPMVVLGIPIYYYKATHNLKQYL